MNLEAIEQHALSYLKQVTNPLVRIEVLHAHLRDHGLAEGLTVRELKDFLSKHELFRVIEPAVPVAELEALGLGEEIPIPSGAYVILDTRVPSDQQLAAMMLDQLVAMQEALRVAKAEALDRADMKRMSAIDAVLQRIRELQQKLAPHGEDVLAEHDENDSGNRPPNIIDFPG